MAVGINVTDDLLREMVADNGQSLYQLSKEQPVLLVFLRHFGCTFCREALADIAERKAEIEAVGTKVVFVHMTDAETAERYFSRYRLEGATHIGDPECKYYAGFGLTKGNLTQLFGLQTWIRGFSVGVVGGHGIGPQLGDGFQMPGMFVILDGEIKSSFIHKLASDRPDYVSLARCCSIGEEQ